MDKIAVLIPCYNEEKTIAKVVADARTALPEAVVYVYDNNSTDRTVELAKEAGAAVVGTGRSDFPNQVNNVIAFPGIFRGALDARAPRITEEMKEAAARAIAAVIPEEELRPDYVLPDPFNPLIVDRIRDAVMELEKA